MLDDFIQTLAKDLDLPNSPQMIDNAYTLPIEEGVSLTITPLPNGFMLSSTLAPCPPTNREGLYAHLLHGNLFGHGTRDCTLGLNEDGSLLTLSKIIDYNVDYKRFKENLEDFINIIDFWREEARIHK